MSRRATPVAKRSRLVPVILTVAIAGVGFATLTIRLEATREGYRLAQLRSEIAKLQEQNRALRLQSAQLSSHARLRSLAPEFHLAPVKPGQVVMLQ